MLFYVATTQQQWFFQSIWTFPTSLFSHQNCLYFSSIEGVFHALHTRNSRFYCWYWFPCSLYILTWLISNLQYFHLRLIYTLCLFSFITLIASQTHVAHGIICKKLYKVILNNLSKNYLYWSKLFYRPNRKKSIYSLSADDKINKKLQFIYVVSIV